MATREIGALLWVCAWLVMASAELGAAQEGARAGIDPAVAELVAESLEATRATPDDATVWKRLCMTYEANLLWPEAAECFARLSEIEGDEDLWRLHQAFARIEAGEVSIARGLLEEIVARGGELGAAHQRLGYLLLEQGEIEAARERFERLREMRPELAAGWIGTGEVELLAGRPEEASAALERALEIDPRARSALYQLGLAYRALGRQEEAERALAMGSGGERVYLPSPLGRQVAELSVHLTGQIERAGELLRLERPQEAAELLEAERRRWPENTTLMNDLAIAYLHLGRMNASRALLEEALRLEPDGFVTHLNLAAWAGYAARPAEAVEHARRAVAAAPGVAATHLALAQALGVPRGDDASKEFAARRREVLVEIERAIEIGVQDPEAYLQLARGRYQEGSVDRALEALDAVLVRWPDFWPGELMSAWILVRSGRFEEGAAVLAGLEEEVPDHPDLAELERMIQEGTAENGG